MNTSFLWIKVRVRIRLWLLDIIGSFKKMPLVISLIFLILLAGLFYNIVKKKTAVPVFVKGELAEVLPGKVEFRALNKRIKKLEISLVEAKKRIRKEKNARKSAQKKAGDLKKAMAAAPGAGEVGSLKEKIKKLKFSLVTANKMAGEQVKARKKAEEEVKAARKKAMEARTAVPPDKGVKVLQEKIKKLEGSLSVAQEKARKEENARKSAEKKAGDLKKAMAAAPGAGEVGSLKEKIKELEISLADAGKRAEEQVQARKRAEEEVKAVRKKTMEARTAVPPDKGVKVLQEKIKKLEGSLSVAQEKARKEENARKSAQKKLGILKMAGAAAPGEVSALKKEIKELEISLADAGKKAEEQLHARKKAEEEAKAARKQAKASGSPDKNVKALKEKVKKLEKSLTIAQEKARKEESARKSAQKKLEAVRKESKETGEKKLRTYTVEEGDTLSNIAEKVYGDSSRWKDIYNANKELLKKKGVVKGLILNITE